MWRDWSIFHELTVGWLFLLSNTVIYWTHREARLRTKIVWHPKPFLNHLPWFDQLFRWERIHLFHTCSLCPVAKVGTRISSLVVWLFILFVWRALSITSSTVHLVKCFLRLGILLLESLFSKILVFQRGVYREWILCWWSVTRFAALTVSGTHICISFAENFAVE